VPWGPETAFWEAWLSNSQIFGDSEAMIELLASGGGSPAPVSLRVALPKRRCGKASAMGTG